MHELLFDVGILITAALGVVGYLFKLRLQQTGSARALLFHLFEIRQELLIERPKLEVLIDEFESELRRIVGDRPCLKELMVNQASRDHIATVLTSLMDGLVRADPKLLESYEAALFEYSRIDPIVSHRVRGMKLLPKLADNLSSIANSLAEVLPEGEEANIATAIGRREIESSRVNRLKELLVDLESNICCVSWKAGPWFRFKSWQILSKRQNEEHQDEGPQFDLHEFMERFFKSIVLTTNASDEIKEQIENATLEQVLDLFEEELSAPRG